MEATYDSPAHDPVFFFLAHGRHRKRNILFKYARWSSLSDDASAKIASELCGQVAKIKGSYTISETSKRAGVSPLSGRAGGSGGGSIGATKSFQERREAVFHPRDFALLGNCQAICLPYDGAQSLEPRRVYLKPHYLPLDHSYWRAKEAGQI